MPRPGPPFPALWPLAYHLLLLVLLVFLSATVVETADSTPPLPQVVAPDVTVVHASPPTLSPPAGGAADTLRLAHTLGNHMVLQQAPLPACLYGQGSPKSLISVTLDRAAAPSTAAVVDAGGKWVACLPPQQAGGPHNLTVAGSGGAITLKDVLFGEVWLCAGQSNMLMSMSQALNATAEIAASGREDNGGPRLRLMAIGRNTSADPLDDLSAPPLLPWSVASYSTVGGEDWMFFSATCYFYGLHLASQKGLAGTPIGLIQAAYGSTELKAWATPESLTTCPPTPPPMPAAAPAAAGGRGGGAGAGDAEVSGKPKEELSPGGPEPSPAIPKAAATPTSSAALQSAAVAAANNATAPTTTTTSSSSSSSVKPKEELWPGGPEPVPAIPKGAATPSTPPATTATASSSAALQSAAVAAADNATAPNSTSASSSAKPKEELWPGGPEPSPAIPKAVTTPTSTTASPPLPPPGKNRRWLQAAMEPAGDSSSSSSGSSSSVKPKEPLWPGGPEPSPAIPKDTTPPSSATTAAAAPTDAAAPSTNSTKPKEELWPGGPEPSPAIPKGAASSRSNSTKPKEELWPGGPEPSPVIPKGAASNSSNSTKPKEELWPGGPEPSPAIPKGTTTTHSSSSAAAPPAESATAPTTSSSSNSTKPKEELWPGAPEPSPAIPKGGAAPPSPLATAATPAAADDAAAAQSAAAAAADNASAPSSSSGSSNSTRPKEELWPGGPDPSPAIPKGGAAAPAAPAANDSAALQSAAAAAADNATASNSSSSSARPKEPLWPGGPEPSPAIPKGAATPPPPSPPTAAAAPGNNRRLLRGLAESDDPVAVEIAGEAAAAVAAGTAGTAGSAAADDPLTPPTSASIPPPKAAAAAAAAPTATGAWMQDWHPEASTCFNAMINPLLRMSMRGVIWDQGEQDVHSPQEDYRCLFPTFIQSWRQRFVYANALGPMAFGFLQLQGYEDPHMDITADGVEVGKIRLAQYSGLAQPRTFLALSYDLNDDASPVGAVHFRDKQDVGERLATAALANVYGQWGSLPWGPMAKEMVTTVGKREGGRAGGKPVEVVGVGGDAGDGGGGAAATLAGSSGAGGKAAAATAAAGAVAGAEAADIARNATSSSFLPFSVLITYEGVGSEGLVDSGINLFELAVYVDDADTEGNSVVASTRTTVMGEDKEKLLVEFELPLDSPLAEEGATRILRYAYRNRPCPANELEEPYVGTWCGVYSTPEGLPALPFVQDV